MAADGETPVFVATGPVGQRTLRLAGESDERGPVVIGVVGVADPIRTTSREAIVALRALGLEVSMATGDRQATAEAIGRHAGLERAVAGAVATGQGGAVRALPQGGPGVAMGRGG